MVVINSLKILFQNLSLYLKKNFIVVLFLLLLTAFSESLMVISSAKFLSVLSIQDLNIQFQEKIPLSNKKTLWGIIFISFVIITNSLRILCLRSTAKLSARVGKELSENSLRTYLYKPFEWHLKSNNSDIIATLITHSNRSVFCSNQLLQLILSIFIICSLSFSIIIVDFQIALLIISLLLISYFFFYKLFGSNLTNTSEIIGKNTKLLVKSINESLGNLRDIKIDNYQEECTSEFSTLDMKCRNSLAKSLFWSNSPRFIIEMIALASIVLTLIFIDLSATQIAKIGSILLASQRLLPSMQLGYASWAGIKVNSKSLSIITSSIDKKLNSKSNLLKNKKFNYEEFKSISLDNVSFSYSGIENEIKYNNIKILKGEKIAILGKSGCGKSTLLDLLIGFLKPKKGAIKIQKTNGEIISNVPLYELINLGHISQSIYLSDRSILENIAFGKNKNEINFDSVLLASKVANIYNFIQKLPKKYESYVGDRGESLSGGQKQRISLARAIYKNAKILFLDEPTSALDEKTEQDIIKTLLKKNKKETIIMITHNEKLADLFDKKIYLD